MKKGKEETKNNKKTLSKHQKIVIAIIVISLLLMAGCAVNIGFACKSRDQANIFTAISGWIGFLATLGVGGVAYCQNVKFEHKTIKKEEIDDLNRKKNSLYANYIEFSNNNDIEMALREICSMQLVDKKSNQYEQYRINIDFILIKFISLSLRQANECYFLQYGNNKLATIHSLYLNSILLLNDIVASDYGESEVAVLKRIKENNEDIYNLYTKIIIDISNDIDFLQQKSLKYKNFNQYISNLRKEVIEQNKKINKESEMFNKKIEIK